MTGTTRKYQTDCRRQYLFPFVEQASPFGLWRGLGIKDLTAEEIDENRREMLRNFPRKSII